MVGQITMEGHEQVSWNLSEALIQQLGGLLQQASVYYVDRRYPRCFDCLKAIKLRVIQSLSEEERNNFITKEEDIMLRNNLDSNEKLIQKEYPKWLDNRKKLVMAIDSYNTLLMDTLQKYGYLIKKQEDVKRMF